MHSHLRRLGPLALLTLLLLAPAALPQGARQDPEVTVSGHVDTAAGALLLNLTARRGATVGVIVSHGEPLQGEVIDRLFTLDLLGEALTVATVPAVRLDTPFRVRVVWPEDLPPDLPWARLPDATGIADIPTLARGTVAAPSPLAYGEGWHASATYAVAPLAQDEGWAQPRVLALSDGMAVAAWVGQRTLYASVSSDGAHTWGAPVVIGDENALIYRFDLAETAEGAVQFVYSWLQDGTQAPVKLARLLPRSGAVDGRSSADVPGWMGGDSPGLVASPAGGAFVLVGRYVPGGADPQGLEVHRLDASGARRLAEFPWPYLVDGVQADTDGVRIGITFSITTDPDLPSRVYFLRSQDAGATWEGPHEVRSLTRLARGMMVRGDAALDAEGTLHAIYEEPSPQGYQARYLRCPLTTTECTTRTVAEEGHGLFPSLSASGTRVWMVWSDRLGTTLQESVDGGLTLRAKFALTSAPSTGFSLPGSTAPGIFPDGRPLLVGTAHDRDGVQQVVALPWFDPAPVHPDLSVKVARSALGRPAYSSDASPPTPSHVEPATGGTHPPTAAPPTTTTPQVIPPAPERAPFEMTVWPEELRLEPGARASVEVRVRNVHNEPLPIETPSITGLPPGVTVQPLPRRSDVLAPGQEAKWTFHVEASPEAGAWNAQARVAARWDSGRPLLDLALPVKVVVPGIPQPPIDVHPWPSPPLFAPAVAVGVGGASAAALLALLLRADWGRALLGAAALPLYTRMKRGDALKHEVRAGVYAFIREHPGARYEEIRRGVDLANGALAFHLRVLQREGYVRCATEWTARRYYPTGAPRVPAESSGNADEVVTRLLAQEPALTASDVARRLNISRQLARYHLRRLETQGKVDAESRGPFVMYRLAGRP